MSERQDVILTRQVISFDGTVLELFGGSDAVRLHVAMISAIKDGEPITIETRSQQQFTIYVADDDAAKRPEVDALLDEVRSAAGLS